MPHNRFFAANLDQNSIEISDAEFHHLAHVMRIKEAERIELVDGQGHLAIGEVEKIERSKAKVKIIDLKKENALKPKIILAIAHLKFSHLEIALEKCTEIGVDQFVIFPTDQSEKFQLSDAQKKRIDQLLISAIKQCGRLYLPEVHFLKSKADLKQFSCQKFFCHLSSKTIKFDSIKPQTEPVMLIIGPEKGLSDQDIFEFENSLNAQPITLGPYIQRAETACISASACMMQKFDFKASE